MLTWTERFARARARTVLVTHTTGLFWWRKTTTTVELNPRFCLEDRNAAFDWNTCASGEVRNLLGYRVEMTPSKRRPTILIPADPTLQTLGISFWEAVNRDEIDMAENCYAAILKRSAELTTPAQPLTATEVDQFLASLNLPTVTPFTPTP